LKHTFALLVLNTLQEQLSVMADITPPKEITNNKNFRPTTRFLRAKREKGGGDGRLFSHTKEKKGKMT